MADNVLQKGPGGLRYHLSFLFLAVFCLYLVIICPGFYWYDTAELTVVSYSLSIAHPPGEPFYILLGKAITFLPLGSVAFKLNLLSSLFATLGAMLVFLIVKELLCLVAHRQEAEQASSLPLWGGWTGALIVVSSHYYWLQALRTELYSLNTAIILLALFVLLRVSARPPYGFKESVISNPGSRLRDYRYFYLLAFFSGLGMAVHPLLLGLAVPGCLIFIYLLPSRRPEGLVPLVLAAGMVLAGLSLYLYLPLASVRNPPIDWRDPERLADLFKILSAHDYQRAFALSPVQLLNNLKQHGAFFLEYFSPWVYIFAALGAWAILRVRWQVFLLFLMVLGGNFCSTALQSELFLNNPDLYGYLSPTFLIITFFSLGGWFLLVRFLCRLSFLRQGIQIVLIAAAALGFALLSIPGDRVLPKRYSEYYLPDVYIKAVFKALPASSILLTYRDQTVFPSWYYIYVERRREDLQFFHKYLAYSSWYLRQAKERYPALFIPFVDDGIQEKNPARFVEGNCGRFPLYSELFVFDDFTFSCRFQPFGFLFSVSPPSAGGIPGREEAFSSFVREYEENRSLYSDTGSDVYRAVYTYLGDFMEFNGEIKRAIHYYELALGLPQTFPDLTEKTKSLYTTPRTGDDFSRKTYSRSRTKIKIAHHYLLSDEGAVRSNLGRLYLKAGMEERGVLVLQEAKEEGVREAVNILGLYYVNQGRYPEAIEEFSHLLAWDIDDKVIAFNNIGSVYLNMGKVEEAIQSYRAVLEIRDNNIEAHRQLAYLLAGEAKLEAAIHHFREVLQEEPEDSLALENLGLAYAKLERYEDARRVWQEALQIDPDLQRVKEFLAHLPPSP